MLKNLYDILIIFLLFATTVLITVHHFSIIFSNTPFKSNSLFITSIFLSFSYGLIMSLFLNIFLFSFLKSSYFFIFCAYHLLSFFIVYILMVLLTLGIILLCKQINKIKYLNNPEIIPFNLQLISVPLYQNNTFLKKLISISYLISFLIFIFVFKNFLIETVSNSNPKDLELFKEDLSYYYNVFFVSSLPVILSLFKIKK